MESPHAPIAQVDPGPTEDAARRARFPRGAAISFDQLEQDAGVGALDRLRAAEPVSWVPALGGWLVTSYGLAREVLGGKGGFTVWAEPNLVRASLGVMMLTSDPPEHDRLRRPFDEPFRMRSVRARFEEPVARRIGELLDAVAPRGACELAEDVAVPFAIGVAGDVLGLSLDEVARIQEFYEAFAGAMVYDGDPEPQRRADAAREELNAILHAELARSRAAADGSVTSAVANDPDPGISDEELVAQLRVILFGAIETIESTLLNTLWLLLAAPDALAAARGDRELLANAIEESLRLIPPVAFVERWTARPTTLGGIELGPGEFVGVSTIAANRDPDVFPDPSRFDPRRENARHHLAFSFGVHHCLGFTMARMQAGIALASILERLDGLELVDAPSPSGFAFRRPAFLQVAWAARG